MIPSDRMALVVPDSAGRLRNWRHARAQPWYGRIVVLVSETTPLDYLDHLDRRGVEHLCVGRRQVDLAVALGRLRETYGVQTIRTDSGGALNGALLAAGLVDRIAVIIAPSVSRDPGAPSVLRLPAPTDRATSLTLVESEVPTDGALWAVYDVGR